MNIPESLNKCNYFFNQIDVNTITAQSISKFFAKVRERIQAKMQKKWESDLIEVQRNDKVGYASIKIDESKIISHGLRFIGCSDVLTEL